MLYSGCTQHMMSDYKMFHSLNSNACEEYDNITIGDNGKGKFVGLDKIAISVISQYQIVASSISKFQSIIDGKIL